jgi:hypothetical protein
MLYSLGSHILQTTQNSCDIVAPLRQETAHEMSVLPSDSQFYGSLLCHMLP